MSDPTSIGLVELTGLDTARAIKFYGEALGWNVEFQDLAAGYAILGCGDSTKLGLAASKKKPGKNGGVPFFSVDNTDAAAERCVAAGGKLVDAPMDFGQMGRSARVTDTEGNVIGLWGPPSGAPPAPAPKASGKKSKKKKKAKKKAAKKKSVTKVPTAAPAKKKSAKKKAAKSSAKKKAAKKKPAKKKAAKKKTASAKPAAPRRRKK